MGFSVFWLPVEEPLLFSPQLQFPSLPAHSGSIDDAAIFLEVAWLMQQKQPITSVPKAKLSFLQVRSQGRKVVRKKTLSQSSSILLLAFVKKFMETRPRDSPLWQAARASGSEAQIQQALAAETSSASKTART